MNNKIIIQLNKLESDARYLLMVANCSKNIKDINFAKKYELIAENFRKKYNIEGGTPCFSRYLPE